MSVAQAIRKAERILPGKETAEDGLDPCWQAIIDVSEHIQKHPDEVWRFTRKWGAHASVDLRMAVATCLLEHLLEYHFAKVFPLAFEACRQSKRFADTFSSCGEFGQTKRCRNLERFRKLKERVGAVSAKKTVQQTGATRSPHKTKRKSSAAGARR